MPPPPPAKEVPRTELPRALAITAAVLCGMFAALVAQILLARRGIELAGVWRDLFSARGLQLRSAGVWWLMAAAAFLIGAAVAGVLSRLPLPWVRFRLLRWIAGAALVIALAHVGHSAALQAGANITVHVTASFAALCAAVLMALFGAYFAAKR
jgi:hypothetical protein